MVQNLCTHFSPPLLSLPSDTPQTVVPYHPFPAPQTLADPSVEATLRGLGFGYRAKYIQKTAALLCEMHGDPQKWLLGLREVPTEQAREELLKLAGVGPKVADCILLMSLDKVRSPFKPVNMHTVDQLTISANSMRSSL
jgi:N-glycosylase/DNA lyase